MFLRELHAPLDSLIQGRKDASKLLRIFNRIGILTVGALLSRYPRNYEDRGLLRTLRCFAEGPVSTTVTVLAHEWFGQGFTKTLKVYIEDESARGALICFNRPYLQKQLPVGSCHRIFGSFDWRFGEIQSTAFSILKAAEGIVPIYPLSEGLTQETLRSLMTRALALPSLKDLEDELPGFIIRRDGLLPKVQALAAVHFPPSWDTLQTARRTLIYEQLFYLEIIVGRRALERRKGPTKNEGGSLPPPFDSQVPPLSPLQRRLIERLPFHLTPGQQQAVEEINRDLDSPWPMARLLQGDVGSGKTLVAFLGMLRSVEPPVEPPPQGKSRPGGLPRGQAALMAPTELLARQHAENAARLLDPLGIRIAYLTGNLKAAGRSRLLQALAAGEIDIVLGTHALFSKDVVYRNLRFVGIDEQHRFGVTQRSLIMSKGDHPDLLMMSATPIPRTLALTVFGDLDVSVIPDMPPGRKPVITRAFMQSHEGRCYDIVRRELEAGHQAYFVYPLISAQEESPGAPSRGRRSRLPKTPPDAGDSSPREKGVGHGPEAENPGELKTLRDAESMARRLGEEIFPGYPVALIHSRLEEEEKRLIMEKFRRGEIRILAATSVVEVGVDVPNATCMVIEHAERFGLSALHQLRGRVGRGEAQSWCILLYADQKVPEKFAGRDPRTLTEAEHTPEANRIIALCQSNDGFVIAEKDLRFRGPGQIAGLEQSGYLSLGIADPVRDAEELARARTDAFAIIEADPGFLLPEHRCIAAVLDRAPPFSDPGW